MTRSVGERAIALVVQASGGRRERGGQIDAAGVDVAQRGKRGRARGRDHGAGCERANRSPGSNAAAGKELPRRDRPPAFALQRQESKTPSPV